MTEITTPLQKLGPGETFKADEDGAHVITGANTHRDILRYVIDDLGWPEVLFHVESMKP